MTPLASEAGLAGRDRMRLTSSARSSMRAARLPAESKADLRCDRPQSLPPKNRSNPAPIHKAHTKNDRQNPGTNANDMDSYPSTYEDPDPDPKKCFPRAAGKHKKNIKQLGDEIFEEFQAVENEGQELWIDVISTFCPLFIDVWPKGLTYKWCTFLRAKDVHVEKGCETSRSEALKRLLFRGSHIPAKPRGTCEELLQEGTPPTKAAFSRQLDQH